MLRFLIFGVSLLLILTACEKQNLKRAEKSLIGTWQVNKIYSAYGERMELGTQTNEEITEEDELGIFIFNEKTVDYNYTRLDTVYEGNSDWVLNRKKINSGFTKIEVYSLTLDDKTYICSFGDETKNAEKNATEIALLFDSTEIGPYTSIMFWLTKQ